MSASMYELLALAMRYVFAGLMVLIVLRAWRLTIIDSARAKKLRRLSPETGIIGEMLVIDGGEKARPGMKYPVTLEGSIGSGKRADIRLRHSTVRRRHGYYIMTDDGLYIRGHASARIGAEGRWLREVTIKDGDELRIGRVTLMLVLTGADAAPEEISRHVLRRRPVREDELPDDTDDEMDNSIFEAPPVSEDDPDDLFLSNPAARMGFETYDEDEYDEFERY